MTQSSFLAQVQVDEQAQVCPYCDQPLGGEPGVRYGFETLHRQCHEALGRDLDTCDQGQAEGDQAAQMTAAEVVAATEAGYDKLASGWVG